MTKQDRAMQFLRRSSSNSLLERSACLAPLGRRNGGLFWMFGNFLDSPCTCISLWKRESVFAWQLLSLVLNASAMWQDFPMN